MDVQRFAETPIEPRLAQWMYLDFADPVSILFAGTPLSSLVEDRQISAPFGHRGGDFHCHDSEICEWCESAIMDHIFLTGSRNEYID
jgi:hypothetical protein